MHADAQYLLELETIAQGLKHGEVFRCEKNPLKYDYNNNNIGIYIALLQTYMCITALYNILLPRSSDSGLPAHKVCTFSTPWGAFQPVAILQAPLANQTTLAFASYRVPILTPGWRVANVDQCLAKGH